MRTTLLWLLGILLAILAALALYAYFFTGTPAAAPAGTTGSVSLPSAGGVTAPTGGSFGHSGSVFSIPSQNGPLVVNDFIHNGETAADVENAGSYLLAGSAGYCLADGTCPHGAASTDFAISYNAQTGVFTIALLKEPLGPVRTEAEQFLEARLGVYGEQLCELNYYLGTPASVNDTFAGKNLGFSFCRGATELPQ